MIAALHFDGRSARGQPVQLRIDDGQLWAQADDGLSPPLRWPLKAVTWPERTRHGQRVVQLPDGGSLQVADAAAFDAWAASAGLAEGWVVRVQQNWRATLVAVLVLVVLLVAGYRWGVPWASRLLVQAVPEALDRSIGDAAWQQIETRWLKPSQVGAQRQAALRQAFERAVQAAYPGAQAPRHELHFRAASADLGPNAFALPGGTIVVTDALLALLQDRDDTLIGVLAHELGHVRHRHGMRALVQVALVGTATGLALGDFSTLLAGAPALLAQLTYSRDAERESDAEAVRVLRAAGLSPAAMAVLFERLATKRAEASQLPLALASHPLDEERVRYFREAAAARP